MFGLTASRNGTQINVLTCAAALAENAFYGVLYGYTPEVFPSPHRGTGDALAAAASRVTGIFAPGKFCFCFLSCSYADQFICSHCCLLAS